MDIVKIIGVGIIALIISVIIKQYKPEFSIYISLISSHSHVEISKIPLWKKYSIHRVNVNYTKNAVCRFEPLYLIKFM